jgi:hypothetical protein
VFLKVDRILDSLGEFTLSDAQTHQSIAERISGGGEQVSVFLKSCLGGSGAGRG